MGEAVLDVREDPRESAKAAAAGAGASVHAWLEPLRDPLLLTPVTAVLAGWSLTFAEHLALRVLDHSVDGPRALSLAWASLPFALLAALAGCAVQAAGLLRNARVAWLVLSATGLGAAAAAGALRPALWIVGLAAVYHFGLKRFRWPGCAVLAAMRGWEMILGAVACAAWMRRNGFPPHVAIDGTTFDDMSNARWFALLYSFYVFGAALHASTDDEPTGSRAVWYSRLGLVICCLGVILFAVSPVGGPLLAETWMITVAGWATLVLGLWALMRIVLAWRSRPPAVVSGTVFSGIYFTTALAALHIDIIAIALLTTAAILLLFGVSRWLRPSHALP